jgi:hypothetical protein
MHARTHQMRGRATHQRRLQLLGKLEEVVRLLLAAGLSLEQRAKQLQVEREVL